jgi:hypothetical protein
MSAQANRPMEAATEKVQYRVTNWPEYDRALVRRGSLTIWFDEEFLRARWRPAPTGRRGAPFQYFDIAIQALLTLKAVFDLPYRMVEGLAGSLIRLLGVALSIPDHTLLSRRAKTLTVQIPRRQRSGPIHVVVDSTGLKVYGEGEWKVRRHGAGKRRTWRKVHHDCSFYPKIMLLVTFLLPPKPPPPGRSRYVSISNCYGRLEMPLQALKWPCGAMNLIR